MSKQIWLLLVYLVCVCLVCAVVVFAIWNHKGVRQYTHARPISYFIIDGNIIDLGYESNRWKQVLFFDANDSLIGDFTRAKFKEAVG